MPIPNKFFDCEPADRIVGDEESEDRLRETTEVWRCQWVYHGQRRFLSIPTGYRSDGASTPRAAALVGLWPDGLIRAAALPHDALYRAKGGAKPEAWLGCTLVNEHGNAVQVTRAEADWVLREFSIAAGMHYQRAMLAWLAVRAFGGMFWGKGAPGFGKVQI